MLRHNTMKKKVVNIDGDATTVDVYGFFFDVRILF